MQSMNRVRIPGTASGRNGPPESSHSIREQERARVARDLHDEVGGNLAAIKLALSTLIERLPSDPRLADQAKYLDGLVDHSMASLKRLYNDLRPAVLDLGLVAALEWLVAEFGKRTEMACALTVASENCDRVVGHLSDDQAIALFRIVQEALTNVGKHAGATCVDVQLGVDSNVLKISIQDNGRGIPPSHHKGFGIRGMRERAEEFEADFDLESDSRGTLVSVSISLLSRPSPAATALTHGGIP